MQLGEMKLGGAVEIEVIIDRTVMYFTSEVVLIIEHNVLINSILFNEQTLGFTDSYQINFLYKSDGKVFAWNNVPVKLVKYHDNVYHMVELIGDGLSYNRREAYRLYVGEEMPLYIITTEGPDIISVLVKDISETGVAFISPIVFDIQHTFRLKMKDNDSIIHLPGVIVRKEPLNHLNSFLYGCKFSEKNHRLSKYIARKQSDDLRKKSEYLSNTANKGF